MATLNKDEFAAVMSSLSGDPVATSKKHINKVLKTMEKCIEDGNGFTFLNGLTVKVVDSDAKIGRNPQNGAEINIPAKKKLKSSFGKKLKDLAAALPVKTKVTE